MSWHSLERLLAHLISLVPLIHFSVSDFLVLGQHQHSHYSCLTNILLPLDVTCLDLCNLLWNPDVVPKPGRMV